MSTPPRPRVVLGDDHALLLDAFSQLLGPFADVVAVARSGGELVREVTRSQPELVITDLSMPGMSGIEATRLIKAMAAPPRVLILTVHVEPSMLEAAFKAGADGYVLKSAASYELVAAIQEVMAGRQFRSAAPEVAAPVTAPLSARDRLTGREREVVELLAQGLTAKAIGSRLGISERTVIFHKNRIRQRLGVRTTVEMLGLVLRNEPFPD